MMWWTKFDTSLAVRKSKEIKVTQIGKICRQDTGSRKLSWFGKQNPIYLYSLTSRLDVFLLNLKVE